MAGAQLWSDHEQYNDDTLHPPKNADKIRAFAETRSMHILRTDRGHMQCDMLNTR
jgi:hypothetical protein